jgi:asparagine synthase (glutamine-hydrolysing)
MTPYLILAWNRQDVRANALAASVRSLLRAEHAHWRQLVDEPGRLIAVPGDGKAITGNLQGMPVFIIGDVFARSPDQTSAEHVLANAASFDDLCSQFAEDCWGAYVAVQLRDGGDISLFRDPIGMLDGFSWKTSGVNFFASAGMPWLGVCAPAGFGVDWQRAAQLLLDSGTLADTPPLNGISTLPPGALLDVRQGRRSVQRLWSPRNFHEYRSLDKPLPNALREIVLNCSQAWIERYPDNMIEISGGFDSAVVAASCRGMKRGVNFFTGQLSGDERRFARDIAAFQHIPLDEMFMPVGKLSETDLEGLPVDVRPGLSSATLFHDRPLTEIAAKRGVSALFTGHGGDSVFFQHPTAMIAADASFPRWDIGAHAALAKWSRNRPGQS